MAFYGVLVEHTFFIFLPLVYAFLPVSPMYRYPHSLHFYLVRYSIVPTSPTPFKGPKRKDETVIFVPTTPGGELKKRYKETIERAKVKVAVAEVPGKSIKSRLQKSDPLRGKE